MLTELKIIKILNKTIDNILDNNNLLEEDIKRIREVIKNNKNEITRLQTAVFQLEKEINSDGNNK